MKRAVGSHTYGLQFPVDIDIHPVQPTTSPPSPVANDPLPGRVTSSRGRRRRTQIPRRSRGGLPCVPEGLSILGFLGKLASPRLGTMVFRENYPSRGLFPPGTRTNQNQGTSEPRQLSLNCGD